MNAGAANILKHAIYLHMITYVNDNMGWYLKNNLVSVAAAADLYSKQDQAVKDFVPYMNDVVESLGINRIDHMHAPISRDYIAFNSQTDFEKFDAAGKQFDFVKGAD